MHGLQTWIQTRLQYGFKGLAVHFALHEVILHGHSLV